MRLFPCHPGHVNTVCASTTTAAHKAARSQLRENILGRLSSAQLSSQICRMRKTQIWIDGIEEVVLSSSPGSRFLGYRNQESGIRKNGFWNLESGIWIQSERGRGLTGPFCSGL